MSTSADKAVKIRENRVRRMAKRQGLELVKSRRRDPRALGYGCYTLADAKTRRIVHDFGPHLDEVEAWLTRDRPTEGDPHAQDPK